ncbi:beta-lactamase protein [Rutstroemia sp. NJR-2017a BVV2]|nr:beta-lactamase protein [Rutstroemia sp. NJR-2017a BVV2]
MAQVSGHCDEKFQAVQKLLQTFLETGDELGASLTVNLDGQNVIDLWGGHTDESKTQPWQHNTIVILNSTTKAVTALAALILIDRGLLDPYAKVSQYWPEFAANGKEDIEVRHILSHTSGLTGWDEKVSLDDLRDFEESVAKLAKQAPWWTPGTASGYHALTYGFLVGKLVRQTTGKTLKQFIAEEIAGPLNADFQLGAEEKDWPRIAKLVSARATGPPPSAKVGRLAGKVFANPRMVNGFSETPEWRKAEIGSGNGHGNANGLARILSAVSLGGVVDGRRILSPETIDLIFKEQANGEDLVTGETLRFGIGYGLTGKNTSLQWLPEGRICLWGGYGGSIIIMDLDRRLTISYAMNKLSNVGLGSERTKAYVKAVYSALGVDLDGNGT